MSDRLKSDKAFLIDEVLTAFPEAVQYLAPALQRDIGFVRNVVSCVPSAAQYFDWNAMLGSISNARTALPLLQTLLAAAATEAQQTQPQAVLQKDDDNEKENENVEGTEKVG